MLSKIQEPDLGEKLSERPDWISKSSPEKVLKKSFKFDSYSLGIQFVNLIAELAEKNNHHPDILIGYCNVEISITTHDVGGLTEKDFQLADLINNTYNNVSV